MNLPLAIIPSRARVNGSLNTRELHFDNEVASVDDGMMVISELFQGGEDLFEWRSSAAIFDEINLRWTTIRRFGRF